MATDWTLVKGGQGGGGPKWEAMATSSTDEYEDLTGHYWEWTRAWTLTGQAGFLGGKWGNKTFTWTNTTDVWRLINWEVATNTKGIKGTVS